MVVFCPPFSNSNTGSLVVTRDHTAQDEQVKAEPQAVFSYTPHTRLFLLSPGCSPWGTPAWPSLLSSKSTSPRMFILGPRASSSGLGDRPHRTLTLVRSGPHAAPIQARAPASSRL